MAHYLSGMPLWAILSFIIIFPASIVYIIRPVRQAAIDAGFTPQRSRNIQVGIFAFYMVYLVYISFLSLSGILQVNTIPPKVMILAGLPLMIILFGFIGNTKVFKQVFSAITLETLIRVHLFRVVGVFFIFLYGYHLLPQQFALSAGLGDIITALLAFPVATMAARRKNWWKAAVYGWSIIGILDIVRLLFIATIIARNSAVTGVDGGLREMTVFPFVWFPAFAPATILFMHTLVFRKLYQQNKPE